MKLDDILNLYQYVGKTTVTGGNTENEHDVNMKDTIEIVKKGLPKLLEKISKGE